MALPRSRSTRQRKLISSTFEGVFRGVFEGVFHLESLQKFRQWKITMEDGRRGSQAPSSVGAKGFRADLFFNPLQ